MNNKNTPLHFLQQNDVSCDGYRAYLQKKQHGQTVVFNPTFLFTQVMFFVYHKMYLEAFLYTLLFATFFNLFFYPSTYVVMFSLGCVVTTMITTSFFAYRLYEMRNERVLHKENYSPSSFFKKVIPSSSTLFNLFKILLAYIVIGWISIFFVLLNASVVLPQAFKGN
jgi:hypothetical protein